MRQKWPLAELFQLNQKILEIMKANELMNAARAVAYAVIPALGRRHETRTEAWRRHASEMQRLLNKVQYARTGITSRNQSKEFAESYDGLLPDYPQICR